MKYSQPINSQNFIAKDYSKNILFNREDFGNDGHILQTVTIPPLTKQREHFHNIQTEVFYILEGFCEIYINGTKYDAKPGDAIICSPGDKHYLWNKSDNNFKLVVFKINIPSDDDTVWSE
ncbi:MAG: cupin domain-containing protein [bacterium]